MSLFNLKIMALATILVGASAVFAQTAPVVDTPTAAEPSQSASSAEETAPPLERPTPTKTKSALRLKKKPPVKTKRFKALNYMTVSLSYVSWGETAALTNGSVAAGAHTNIIGNAFSVGWEHYFAPRLGFDLIGSYMIGVADVGGTQLAPSYNLINQNWSGYAGSAHFAYRITRRVIATAGPIVVYRSLPLPQDPSGTTAQSGATLNYGGTIALRIRLFNWLDVRQEFGTLTKNASTYWSLGAGLKF